MSASSRHTAYPDEPETMLLNLTLDCKLSYYYMDFLMEKSREYITLQWASRGLRLNTSMSKASLFLKPLLGKSWAFFHRTMEFSAVMPGAQHFSTSESRKKNQSLFNSAQCNPNLLLISTGLTAQSPKAVLQHCWGQKIPTAGSKELYPTATQVFLFRRTLMQGPHLLHVIASRWWCN